MKRTLAAVACLALFSCTQTNEVVERVSLSTENLQPLTNGYYQLWVTFYQFNRTAPGDAPQHEGEYVSVGTFTVTSDGGLRAVGGGPLAFQLPHGANTQLLKDAVISVQTENTEQPQSILMGGSFRGDAVSATATFDIAYADAFGTTFASAGGVCTIVAPTSPPDSNSGVWFVHLGSTPSAGLTNLPVLPQGWRYEGWVLQPITGGGYRALSTGTFVRADSADFDGAGPFAGNAGAPFNFPGQDFVRGAVILNLLSSGLVFKVSIEPSPDNSPEPFPLTLLQSDSIGATPTRVQTLRNVIAVVAPKGKLIIQR